MSSVSLTAQLAGHLAVGPLAVSIAVLLVGIAVRGFALSLDLNHVGITQAWVSVFGARRAEGPLAIASGLPLSTCSTSVTQRSVSVRNHRVVLRDITVGSSEQLGGARCRAGWLESVTREPGA